MDPSRAFSNTDTELADECDMMDVDDESSEGQMDFSDDNAGIRQVLQSRSNSPSSLRRNGKDEAPSEPQNERDGNKFLEFITDERRREITDHVIGCIRHYQKYKKPPLEVAVKLTAENLEMSEIVTRGVFRAIEDAMHTQNAQHARHARAAAPSAHSAAGRPAAADAQEHKYQRGPADDGVPAVPENEPFMEWEHRIRNCTIEQLKVLISDMFADFGGRGEFLLQPGECEGELLGRIMGEAFDTKYPGPANLGIDLISDRADRYSSKALVLYISYLREKADDDDWEEHREMLDAVFIRIKLLQTIREATSQYMLTHHESYRSFWTHMQGINQIVPNPDTSKSQDALLFCTYAAQSEGLQHDGERVMKQIKINGNPIRAFKKHYNDMEEWIYSLTRHVKSKAHQILHAERGLVKSTAQTLSQCNYSAFPQFKPNAAWMAFRNGMLNLYTDDFLAHDDSEIPRDVIACVFHNCDLPWEELKEYVGDWDNPLWANIDTPMKKIYELQFPPGEGENNEIIKFFLAFIGRLMYPHGVFDDWQLAPCFFGNAKTGKSVVLAAISTFFNSEDISTIGNTTQNTFGLESCADSKIVIMEEITRAIQLDQGNWNSMVTGGRMEINIKYKKAKSIDWNARLVMAGNEGLGSYNNVQGSMVRRILVFMFQHRPRVMDTMLKARLEKNPSKFIVMCMRAYRSLVKKVAQVSPFAKDLKSLVPTYFQEQRALMASDSSPIERMLMNPEYIAFPTSKEKADCVYVPETVLIDVFKTFCKDQSIVYVPPSTTMDKMLLQYGIARAKTNSKSGRAYKVYPRPLNAPYKSPKYSVTGRKFFVGVDVSARFAHSDYRPLLPVEAYCEHSREYKTSLHYQGGNSDQNVDDEKMVWDYNVFMQRYEEQISRHSWTAHFGPSFIHGLTQVRQFYNEAVDHLDEILSSIDSKDQCTVNDMMNELESCLRTRSSPSPSS